MRLTMGISPCPNDTFMFHDVAAGALSSDGYAVELHLHDIETLNALALEGRYDVTKLSAACALKVGGTYRTLDSGGAFGFGCGPLVVARGPLAPDAVARGRVALPGENTTAHLLFRLWAPHAARRLFVPYDRIVGAVLSGEADVGVVIHESRFVVAEAGLTRLADLGEWWESETGLPLPLGCVAARRSLGDATLADLDRLLRRGIAHSRAEPDATLPYVRRHAAELDDSVIRRHIALYVNDYSDRLGESGRQALTTLERRAREAGVLP